MASWVGSRVRRSSERVSRVTAKVDAAAPKRVEADVQEKKVRECESPDRKRQAAEPHSQESTPSSRQAPSSGNLVVTVSGGSSSSGSHARAEVRESLPSAATPGSNGDAAVAGGRAGTRKSFSRKAGETLTSNLPVEEFFLTNLFTDDPERLLIVEHAEPLASVLQQFHQLKLTSCVVNLASGGQDFFDCMDFASYLLEVVSGGAPSILEIRRACEDWDGIKKKLRRIAQEPVRKALRGGLARSSASGCKRGSFERFDSGQSLDALAVLLSSSRPVPVFRGGELSRTVSATDVLEVCMNMTEDSKATLEKVLIQEVITQVPEALSKHGVSEEQTLLEVLYVMREAGVHVVPVLASKDDECGNNFGRGLDVAMRVTQSGTIHITPDESRMIAGQFDITALRALFLKSRAGETDRDGDVESPVVGQWWWEDTSVTSNLLLETAMDFVSFCPSALGTGENVAVPYAAVLSSEPLTKAISRTIASSHHSVVVYHVDSSRFEGQARGKPPAGLATALGLLTGMLESGLFRKLTFDTSEPVVFRRQGRGVRKPTLTMQSVQVALDEAENFEASQSRKCKVCFNHVVELDGLVVPLCPDHAAHFMRFTKDGDSGQSVMDFPSLKDTVHENQVIGAVGSCLACQRTAGCITRTDSMASADGSVVSAAGFYSGFGEIAVANQVSSTSSRGGKVQKSALKAGTPGAGRNAEGIGTPTAKSPSKAREQKGGSNDRVDGSRSARGTDKSPTSVTNKGWALSFCCSSQCMTASKETIPTQAMGRSPPLSERRRSCRASVSEGEVSRDGFDSSRSSSQASPKRVKSGSPKGR